MQVLYWAVGCEGDLYLARTLLKYQAESRGAFRFIPFVSRPGPTWTGLSGRITRAALEASLVEVAADEARVPVDPTAAPLDAAVARVMLTGPPSFVEGVRRALREIGFPESAIQTWWTGPADAQL
jgi:NAD(P)H-flavin reductase